MASNMLATRLRELEAAGVLYRLPLRRNTRACALTDPGLALRVVIDSLREWGVEQTEGSHDVDARSASD
jgi:DNA-binding HxlR family transcriptional regulator